MTLKQIIIDAIATQPKAFFSSADIVRDVLQLKPLANVGSIRTCIRRDLVKDGVVVKAGKRLWKLAQPIKPCVEDITTNAAELGSAMIDYVEKLRKDIELWKIKAADLKIKFDHDEKEWRAIVKAKDETIARLNQRIIASNKTFSFNSPRIVP